MPSSPNNNHNHNPNHNHNHKPTHTSNGDRRSKSKRSPILSNVCEVTYEYACHSLANLAHPFRSLFRQTKDPKSKPDAKFTGHPSPLREWLSRHSV